MTDLEPPAIRPASAHLSALSGAATFAAAALIAFFLTPRILASIGDARYSIFTLADSVIGYYGLLDLGIRGAVSYYVARLTAERKDAELRLTVRTAFWNLAAIAAAALLLTSALISLLPRFVSITSIEPAEVQTALGILLGAFALSLPFCVPNGVLVGMRRLDISNGCQIAAQFITAAVLVALLTTSRATLLTVSLAQAGGSMLTWMFQSACLRYLGFRTRVWPPVLHTAQTRAIYTFGGANLLLQAVGILGFTMAAPTIAHVLGAVAVTRYYIGRYLAFNSYNLMSRIAAALTAEFTFAAARQDLVRLQSLYLQASRSILGVSTLLCSGVAVFGPAFISLWISPDYLAGPFWNRSSTVLYFAVLNVWFRIGALVTFQFLHGTRELRFLVRWRSIEAAVHLPLLYLLVSVLGIAGANVANFTVAASLGVLPMWMFTSRKLGITSRLYLAEVLFPSLWVAAATAGTGMALSHWLSPATSWMAFFAEVAVAGGAGAAAVWTFVFSPGQRAAYLSKVPLLGAISGGARRP